MSIVYIVGSQEEHFIADRVYSPTNLDGAADYCDELNKTNRERGKSQWWVVMAAPLNDDWMSWKVVHDRNGIRPTLLESRP